MVSAVGGLSQIVNQVNGNYDYVTALAAAQTACVQFILKRRKHGPLGP